MARPKMSDYDKDRAIIIGKNIASILSTRKITKKEFSDKLQIPYSTLLDYLNGKTLMPLGIIQKCSIELDISKGDIDPIFNETIDEEELKKVFSKNLNHYLQTRKKNQQDLVDELGLKQSTVSDWMNGKKYPRIDKLQLLADYFDILKSDLTENKTSLHTSKRGVSIPVLGKVIAGIPVEAVEEIIDYEEIDSNLAKSGEFFALQIKGDSMEPRMQEGDVVIVRKQETAETGDIAIVLVNGDEATVKKIKILKDGIMLIPFNNKYDPWEYTADDIANMPVKIIGKVIELRAKF